MIKLKTVPQDLPVHHQQFLTDLRNAVLELQGSHSPANIPTNLKVTPVAGGNVVQFTRGTNAAGHTLYMASFPNFAAATPVQLGQNAQHIDSVGIGGVLRYYWVRSFDGTGKGSTLVGPISSRTLALGATATVSKPPPPSSPLAVDATTGQLVGGIITRAGFKKF